MSRYMCKLCHKLRHGQNWPHCRQNFLNIFSNYFTNNLSPYSFTNLKQFLQSFFSILSSRMSKNMWKMFCQYKNVKQCCKLILSLYFRNSIGQIHKYLGTKYPFLAFIWLTLYTRRWQNSKTRFERRKVNKKTGLKWPQVLRPKHITRVCLSCFIPVLLSVELTF